MTTKHSILQAISGLVSKAIELELITPLDKIYVTNRLLSLVNIQQLNVNENNKKMPDHLLTAMDIIVNYAVKTNIIQPLTYQIEQFEAKIMDLFTPQPSILQKNFWDKYKQDRINATDYFYSLVQYNDYIKTRQVAKNISFVTPSPYGELEITINLSKPEKTPQEIALARETPQSSYPKCALCFENEGHAGSVLQAARQNHRIIRFNLGDEVYGFQFSPYVYYDEHSIFINESHIPMKVDEKCFRNLIEITDIFPHYFVGSNADLPIVGGSILSHDHYQGGRYSFPMEKAQSIETITLSKYPDLEAEIVNWPMSVLRIRSANKSEIVKAALDITETWRNYSDESVDILCETNGVPHNTVTPIARRKGVDFELDLVLRNNRTNEEYPDGIFHPHSDVQHIKKENIGLIEVMGLAILPPRLISETEQVKQFLEGRLELEEVAAIHQPWAIELAQKAHTSNHKTQELIESSLGKKFTRILEDAGVFKHTSKGRKAFASFIDDLNQKEE